MSNKAIIVSGGALNEELVLNTIRRAENPCIIGVDKGVEFLYGTKSFPVTSLVILTVYPEILWTTIRMRQKFLSGNIIR